MFDSVEASNWIFRLANRLHRDTRESVIRSELLFSTGKRYDSAATAESVRNLRALGHFRDVGIVTFTTDTGLTERVTTRDAWSTAVGIDVQSTGDQVSYNFSFAETNFLGTASRVRAGYSKYPDYTAFDAEFYQPRLIENRIGLELYHQQRSDGHQSTIIVDEPFRALASPFGASVTLHEFDGRVLRYFNGVATPSDTLENRTTQLVIQGAKALLGNAHGYVRLGAIAQLLRSDYVKESVAPAFPNHTVFTFGPTLAISRARFKVTSNYEHLRQAEDVDLSTTLTLGTLFATKAGGSPRSGIGPFGSFRIGAELPDGFGILNGIASGLFTNAGLDSGSAVLAGTGIFRLGGSRQRLLVHVEGGMAHNIAPVDQFDLGFGLGPRGFAAHSFTGDRYHFSTIEYRFTAAPELAKLAGIGLAAFADYGGAWYQGSHPRSGSDVGVGIRVGPTRQADLRTLRVDLVRRFANDAQGAGWVVVLGKGFPFTLAQ